jgi:hypothetical protein
MPLRYGAHPRWRNAELPPEGLTALGLGLGGGRASYPLLFKYSEERTNSEPQLYKDDSAPWSGIMPKYVEEIVATSRKSAGITVRRASPTTWSVWFGGGGTDALCATSGHSTCDQHSKAALENPDACKARTGRCRVCVFACSAARRGVCHRGSGARHPRHQLHVRVAGGAHQGPGVVLLGVRGGCVQRRRRLLCGRLLVRQARRTTRSKRHFRGMWLRAIVGKDDDGAT